MSDLNDPLKESYIGKVGDALKSFAPELKTKGLDVTDRVTQLTGAGDQIEAAVKLRWAAEKALADAVANVHTIREGHYTTATATVSAVEGVLGKDHVLSVKLRALRGELIGHQNPDATPTPAPATKTA